MNKHRAGSRVFNTKIPNPAVENKAEILHLLRERVKELTALHSAARILQYDERPLKEVFSAILELLPPAWQYPQITAARIKFDREIYATPNFSSSPWKQRTTFKTADGKKGEIEIRYLKKMPDETEGPFLSEERYLINSLAEMLGAYTERKSARKSILNAKNDLELRVRQRTAELEQLNYTLLDEIAKRRKKERKIRAYQEKLRRMTAELAITEERERRDLAAELHERLGHNLAIIKMKLALKPHRSARELLPHIDDAIKMTRNLTFELGSPVLYELGFKAAVESLAEQFRAKHGIKTNVLCSGKIGNIDDSIKLLLFKAVRELLHNTVKHACASEVSIALTGRNGRIIIGVSDNGCGFDTSVKPAASNGFGLFSIKERLGRFGGNIKIKSEKKSGTTVTLESPAQLKTKEQL